MSKSPGVSLVELLVVLAIIGIILGMLIPAVQYARERARETLCQNNIHQMNIALTNFEETTKKRPRLYRAGKVGGWIVDILPFIEQQNLHATLAIGADANAAAPGLFTPPPIFLCPRTTSLDAAGTGKMLRAHYTLVTLSRSKYVSGVADSPLDMTIPWITGPEMEHDIIFNKKGPHHNGFYFSRMAQQGIGFMVDGQEVQ